MAKKTSADQRDKRLLLKSRWVWIGLVGVGLLAACGIYWVSAARASQEIKEAPEAQKILDVQATLPFQILIPAYLPKQFDRENMEVAIDQIGPGGEPMVQLTYQTENGSALFVKEWLPVHPAMEILAASRPVQTNWGPGWMLKQGEDLLVIWVDIGPLRASIYTSDLTLVDRDHILAIANNMGPASNRQVFNFVVDPPHVQEVQPPPPVDIEVNEEGIQEVSLVITPGGYTPLRFAVKKGVPVRLIFRQLGQVGCGNELNFPTADGNMASLKLRTATDKQVLEFTPIQTGEFTFFCGHNMYRGKMTVKE
jgi:hypothetical protein